MVRFAIATLLGALWLLTTTLSGCVIVLSEDDATDAHWVVDHDDHHSAARPVADDEALLEDVQARFNADSFLSQAPIVIAARDGVVTLRGELRSAQTLERAVRIVAQAPGVESVVMKVVLITHQ